MSSGSFSNDAIKRMEDIGANGGFVNTNDMSATDRQAADAAVIRGQQSTKKS